MRELTHAEHAAFAGLRSDVNPDYGHKPPVRNIIREALDHLPHSAFAQMEGLRGLHEQMLRQQEAHLQEVLPWDQEDATIKTPEVVLTRPRLPLFVLSGAAARDDVVNALIRRRT